LQKRTKNMNNTTSTHAKQFRLRENFSKTKLLVLSLSRLGGEKKTNHIKNTTNE